MRSVADADFVRRQNRSLVLTTLRRGGAMSRTQLATATGLSHSSITAIGGELINQSILVEGEVLSSAGARGRPAVQVGFNRRAAHAVIVEIDVNRVRLSLVDYAGTLVDRIETPVTATLFAETAAGAFLSERILLLKHRNPDELATLKGIAVSAQGILDRSGDSLKWSPIAHIAGQSIVEALFRDFEVPVSLQKRGGLLADGTRALYPALGDVPLAAIFIGSTVAMGLSLPERQGQDSGATEFGHMNHLPAGARCRCGMRGCIEAYAADYGVLRSAYGVPDEVPPAASVPTAAYQELIHLAKSGRRNALHAFNVAGRSLGFGLNRLLTLAAPQHIVITGPGAAAFELMRPEMYAALKDSLVCKINGTPAITVHHDEREPIFQGMLIGALASLDTTFSAALGPQLRVARIS